MARFVNVRYDRWMTHRDRQIVVSVYFHGILNSRQVEEMFFRGANNSRIIALRRLKKLVDNNFLKQHWYGYNNKATMQHFTITNRGSMVVSSELDIDYSTIKINDAGILSNIEHTSLIADFHVDLLKSGFEVKNYTSERHNRVNIILNNREASFEPDGKGVIKSKSGRVYPIYLEMDRGTMSYDYFAEKIPKYEAYYASGKYANEFSTFPLVITITTDQTRLKRMVSIVEKIKRSDINYLFTTIDQSKNPSGLIYNVVGREGLVGLK